MNVAHKTEKMEKVVFANLEEQKIYVTHITIRQSIFFLLLKLFSLEIIAAACLVAFYSFILSSQIVAAISNAYYAYVIPFFLLLVLIKISFMAFIIIEWLEEYYEITTKEVIHRRGIFFKREERFTLRHLGTIKIQQGVLGRLFHYGTLTLYDWVNEKEVYLYLIHNPMKYHQILQHIAPEADIEKKVFREHILEKEDA